MLAGFLNKKLFLSFQNVDAMNMVQVQLIVMTLANVPKILILYTLFKCHLHLNLLLFRYMQDQCSRV